MEAPPRSTIWPSPASDAIASKVRTSRRATRDPHAGTLVPLYHPCRDRWSEHFRLEGALILPTTPVGRGTATLLRLNDEQRVMLRLVLVQQGHYLPPQAEGMPS